MWHPDGVYQHVGDTQLLFGSPLGYSPLPGATRDVLDDHSLPACWPHPDQDMPRLVRKRVHMPLNTPLCDPGLRAQFFYPTRPITLDAQSCQALFQSELTASQRLATYLAVAR